MRTLDGEAAGGQFLRTALSLSVLTETSVRIEHVRADRPEPGLKSQHAAAVDVLAAICDADVTGTDVGSTTVTFEPGPISTNHVDVDVGTAGSVALVFDAVLPIAARLTEPLSVTATGGTDVTWSPPLASLTHVKLPLLRRHGVQAAVERDRTGFYPAGGGRATLHLGQSTIAPIDCTCRGDGRGAVVRSIASEGLGDADVADRQATAAVDRLADSGLTVHHSTTTYAETACAGTSILVSLAYEQTRAGFDALGEPGLPAEDVGQRAAEAALAFHEGDAVVDEHMADQLLVFAAIAGGTLVIPRMTEHVETSLALLEEFGLEVHVDDGPGYVQITVHDGLESAALGR